jgi:hypothetical protein
MNEDHVRFLEELAQKGYHPGDKINRVDLFTRVVASIGYAADWAAYAGSYEWDYESIASNGDKISEEDAKRIFPEIAALDLRYRY